jgi:release factor glutamine methyltransferase
VPSEDSHFDGDLAHEPRHALDGGADGLDAFRNILGKAAEFLTPGGRLAFEHGCDQRAALTHLAADFGFFVIEAADDLAGHPRAVVFAQVNDG